MEAVNGSDSFWENHDAETMRRLKMTLTCFYSFLFVTGVSGNLWVAISVGRIFIANRGKTRRSRRISAAKVQEQVKVYILALSLVDLCVLLIIPFHLTDFITGHWIFGHLFCKLYWVIESINKVLSGCLLATLAFDRYKSITLGGSRSCVQSRRSAATLILVVTGCVVVLVSPSFIFSEVREIPIRPNETLSKCSETIPQTLIPFFTSLLFTFGFCLPVVLILFFNCKILHFLRNHATTSLVRSNIHLKRVVLKIMLTVLFHFLCLTPYWLFVLLGSYHGPRFILFFYKYKFYVNASLFIHTLPSLNSAANWIFYALINKDIRHELQCHSTTETSDHLPLRNMRFSEGELQLHRTELVVDEKRGQIKRQSEPTSFRTNSIPNGHA